jgi:hypothetical protein
VKLIRHVGGLSRARQAHYLRARGWHEDGRGWRSEIFGLLPLSKALHHQLTDDLSQALRQRGWEVAGFSERGYVQMREGARGKPCSLPKALRTQARREQRPVAELTYALFLAALLEAEGP